MLGSVYMMVTVNLQELTPAIKQNKEIPFSEIAVVKKGLSAKAANRPLISEVKTLLRTAGLL